MRFLRSILFAMGILSAQDQRDVLKKARTVSLRKPRRRSARINRKRHDPVFAAATSIEKIESRRTHKSLHPKHIDRGAYREDAYTCAPPHGQDNPPGILYRAAPAGWRWQNNQLVARR